RRQSPASDRYFGEPRSGQGRAHPRSERPSGRFQLAAAWRRHRYGPSGDPCSALRFGAGAGESGGRATPRRADGQRHSTGAAAFAHRRSVASTVLLFEFIPVIVASTPEGASYWASATLGGTTSPAAAQL